VRSSQFVEVGFGGEQRAQTPITALETVLAVDGVDDATGDRSITTAKRESSPNLTDTKPMPVACCTAGSAAI